MRLCASAVLLLGLFAAPAAAQLGGQGRATSQHDHSTAGKGGTTLAPSSISLGGVSRSTWPAVAVFESAETAIVASTNISWTHGLGGTPRIFQIVLRNKSAEHSYSVGDEVLLSNTDSGDSVYRNTGWANATQCGIKLGSRPFLIADGGAGYVTPTLASWRLVCKAIR